MSISSLKCNATMPNFCLRGLPSTAMRHCAYGSEICSIPINTDRCSAFYMTTSGSTTYCTPVAGLRCMISFITMARDTRTAWTISTRRWEKRAPICFPLIYSCTQGSTQTEASKCASLYPKQTIKLSLKHWRIWTWESPRAVFLKAPATAEPVPPLRSR